jgi:hydrogenase expression/formation protein HypE
MTGREEKILLGHGSGGRLMQQLISEIFLAHFDNEMLREQSDSAILKLDSSEIAFTTDSFVIDPLFFPGGNIGKLAICGTVNDLSVSGADPLYISASFIIEEGFPMNDLEAIVISMAGEAKNAGITVVTGDTKVVPNGKCDKLFINTAGIGRIRNNRNGVPRIADIVPGDVVIINGTIGDHGMAVMNARESFNFSTGIESDCNCLNGLIRQMLDCCYGVKFMRDPTRGGVATVLNELTGRKSFGIRMDETALPVNSKVRVMSELLGFDPLYMANEGKVIAVADQKDSGTLLAVMKNHELGRQSCIIGEIVNDHPGRVVLKTLTGGSRIIDTLTSDQLPRIC